MRIKWEVASLTAFARNDGITRPMSRFVYRVVPSLREARRESEKRHPEQPRKCCEGTHTLLSFSYNRAQKIIGGVIIISLFISILLSGCSSASKPQTKLIVPSTFTKEKIKADGNVTEKIWKTGKFTKIKTKNGPEVYMKSAYGDKNIHFLVKWRDATENKVSKVWQYDGAKWTNGPEQDKMSILWDKSDSVAYFNIKGCAAVCHTENKDKNLWYMAANSRKEKTDLWFWMAGITNVYGFVEDRYLDDTVDPTLMKAARKRDQGDPGFLKNGYKTPVERIAPTRPTKKLVEGLTVEATPYPNSMQMEDITTYKVFQAGDKEPFIYFYGSPTGSAADVLGHGIWKDGWWHVEISRALDTGHKDDMPFKPEDGESVYYMFGLALFDQTEPPPILHSTSDPISLELVPKSR